MGLYQGLPVCLPSTNVTQHLTPSLIPRAFSKEMNTLGTRLLTPKPSPSIFRPQFIEYQFVISRPHKFPVMLRMC